MIAESAGKIDPYAIRHLADHLYEAGPEMYRELYDLFNSKKWYLESQDYDPSMYNYLRGLERAILAAEKNPQFPQDLFPLFFLGAITGSREDLPDSAISTLFYIDQNQLFDQWYAEAVDELDRIDLLCRNAISEWRQGHAKSALASLDEASKLALNIFESNPDIYLLVKVATTAHEIQAQDYYDRLLPKIRDSMPFEEGSISHMVREFKLLDNPKFISALTQEEEDDELSIIARFAGEDGNKELVKEIVEIAKNEISTSEDDIEYVIEELIKTGHAKEALQIIDHWQIASMDLDSRLKLARLAGRAGDIETIEKLILDTPSFETAEEEDDYLDMEDLVKGTILNAMKGTGRLLFGLEPNQLKVLWAGFEGLGDLHPKQIKTLLERILSNNSGAGKIFAKALATLILPTTPRKSNTFQSALNLSWRLAAQYFDEYDRDEVFFNLAVTKAHFGDFDQAFTFLDKVDFFDRSELLEIMAEIALEKSDIENALKIVYLFDDEADETIEDIFEALIELPSDQAKVYSKELFSLFNRLRDDAREQIDQLFKELLLASSRRYSASYVLKLIEEFGLELGVSELELYSQIALEQNDASTANHYFNILEQLVKLRSPEINLKYPFQIIEGMYQPDPIIDFSSNLAVHWAQTAEHATDPGVAKQWKSLAKRAFWLTQERAQKLPSDDQQWSWPYLTRAARYLKEKNVLHEIWEVIEKTGFGFLKGPEIDQTLVHIAVGLTLTGEDIYYTPKRDYFVPNNLDVISRIQRIPYKMQALVETSLALRDMPNRKLLFWEVESKEDLDNEAERFLKNAKRLLKLQSAKISKNSRLSRKPTKKLSLPKPIFNVPGRKPNRTLDREPIGEPLCAVIEVFAERGWYKEVVKIAEELASEHEREKVYACAVMSLRKGGKKKRARKLLANLPPAKDGFISRDQKTLTFARIAEEQALSNPDKAWKTFKTKVEPGLWQSANLGLVLSSCTKVVLQSVPERRLEYVKDIVINMFEYPEANIPATLAPVLLSLMDEAQFKLTLRKLNEITQFWSRKSNFEYN